MDDQTSADEIKHYNQVASSDETRRQEVALRLRSFRALGADWCEPTVDTWLDSVYDCAAQADVFEHLKPAVANGHVVQLGGSGIAAIKTLIGGAVKATLVTPASAEATFAEKLALELGYEDRFNAVVAFGEDSTLPSGTATAVISEACLHHMVVPQALAEGSRLLAPGGRFGSWDPWRASLYGIGVAIFGKRDPAVNCIPLDSVRVEAFPRVFHQSEVRMHGALTRYPSIVSGKLGARIGIPTMRRITRADDAFSSRFQTLRRNGSSIAMLGIKQ